MAISMAAYSAHCDQCSWEAPDSTSADGTKNLAQAHANGMRHTVQIRMAIPKMYYDTVRPTDARGR